MLSNLKKGIFPFIIVFSALSVSASAAFYSVSGLIKLFAGAALAVGLMAASLEIAKLVIASLLYQYRKSLPTFLKYYLSIACFVLILITSIGIYGFLSAAYQETASKAGSIDSQIALIETRRDNTKEQLRAYTGEKESINKAVADLRSGLANNVIQYTNSEGVLVTTTSSSTRRALEKQLDQAIKRQTDVNTRVDELNTKLFEYETEIVKIKTDPSVAGELGPLKFISNLTGVAMDKIINILLLIIIFVFDPLAISLVVAANFAFEKAYPKKEYKENLYGEKEEIKLEDVFDDEKEEGLKEFISKQKQKQRQRIIEIMALDEANGIYDELEYKSPIDFDDDNAEGILKKKEYEHSQMKNYTSDTKQRQRLEEEIKLLQKLVDNGETKLY